MAEYRGYQAIIHEMLAGRDYDPRHIEGFMRLQYSTLDHLSRDDFKREVEINILCIDEGGTEQAETLAKSYGL
jgi:hypothetical protein